MYKNTLWVSFLVFATAVFPIQTEGKKALYRIREDQTQEKSKEEKKKKKEKEKEERRIKREIKETRKTKEQPIKIIGTDAFIKKTEEALALIKEKSPRSYVIVKNYLSVIRPGEQSGIRTTADPPTYNVGPRTFDASLTWYASCIVHDAYHSKLYRDYRKEHNGERVPSEIYSGRDAENACISAQEKFLSDVGAPMFEIEHLQSRRYVDYFSSKERDW